MTAEKYIESYPQHADLLEELKDLFNSFGDAPRGRNIECGPGWLHILLDCHKYLKLIYPDYEIIQIKEKFGGLRYYVGSIPNDLRFGIDAIITYAESKAYHTCEECGASDYKANVKLREGGWVHTMCDACEIRYQEKKKLRDTKLNQTGTTL